MGQSAGERTTPMPLNTIHLRLRHTPSHSRTPNLHLSRKLQQPALSPLLEVR